MTRILIADDHAIVREGLRRILSDETSFEVVGEASDGFKAASLARELKPDIVLLDLSMPGRGGVDALSDILTGSPKSKVLILSMHPEDQYAIRCLQEGADGYLTKESAPDLLVEAIQRILEGRKFVSSALAEQLVFHLNQDGRPLHERLSGRELQVLAMIGKGQTVSQIADKLCVSVKTVSTYRTRLLNKLGLENNAQLMRYAIDHDLT